MLCIGIMYHIVHVAFGNAIDHLVSTALQAYHSQYTSPPGLVANMALLPVRTQYRGPAPKATDTDIIDEAIGYFKANVFFRTYEIKVCFLVLSNLSVSDSQ